MNIEKIDIIDTDINYQEIAKTSGIPFVETLILTKVNCIIDSLYSYTKFYKSTKLKPSDTELFRFRSLMKHVEWLFNIANSLNINISEEIIQKHYTINKHFKFSFTTLNFKLFFKNKLQIVIESINSYLFKFKFD